MIIENGSLLTAGVEGVVGGRILKSKSELQNRNRDSLGSPQ